jgi:hypothetical protein
MDVLASIQTTFALLEYFVRSRDRAYRLLAVEQERSERLLLSIFPPPIAERLKVSQGVIAERSEEVSVLFADITGFTPAAERLPPEEVVAILDEIFSASTSRRRARPGRSRRSGTATRRRRDPDAQPTGPRRPPAPRSPCGSLAALCRGGPQPG